MSGVRCPRCGSSQVACIVYGTPVWSPQLDDADREGRIIYDRCCAREGDPDRMCRSCGGKWSSVPTALTGV